MKLWPDTAAPQSEDFGAFGGAKTPVYALGHAMVKLYLADTGQTAAQAVHVPADEILPYLNKVIDPTWTPPHRPVRGIVPERSPLTSVLSEFSCY